MKRLLILLLPLLLDFGAFGANPPYEAFLGTNGIIVTSNPPQGKIIIDGRLLTNNLSAASARILTLPTVAGLGWYDGTNQYYSTNLTANVNVLLTNLMEGIEYFLQVSNPASFAVTFTSLGDPNWIEHPYVSASATTNGITLYTFQRWGTKTNAFDQGRSLSLTNDDGTILFTTNRDSLIIRALITGTMHVWTNDNGTLKPVVFPADILFQPGAPEGTVATNYYFNSQVYRTNGGAKLFAIYNGTSNAMTIGGNGQIMLGRGNGTPFPGVVLYGIYDTALGETNQQEIFTESKNSTVGYSGAADLIVDTNYGSLILFANKEGGVKFTRFAIQAGQGANPQNFNSFTMQALVDGATYMQMDPNFSLLTPTNYLFSSSVRITNTDMLMSLQNSNFPVFEVDGVGDLRKLKKIPYTWPAAQGAAFSTLVNDGSGNLAWQIGAVAPGVLTGTTNFFNLSVQAAKLPGTNYASIDAGWQAWETVYPKTNDVGAQVNLNASWQFMVPSDYATNSLKLLINYSLLGTNGPNTSNVVFAASVLSIRSGTTNNVHTNVFGSVVRGSNDWIAKYDGTNIVTNLVINLSTSSLLAPRDLAEIKLERRPTEDTFGGAVAVHGLQIEYTRP